MTFNEVITLLIIQIFIALVFTVLGYRMGQKKDQLIEMPMANQGRETEENEDPFREDNID